jgi:hypothetical protein
MGIDWRIDLIRRRFPSRLRVRKFQEFKRLVRYWIIGAHEMFLATELVRGIPR